MNWQIKFIPEAKKDYDRLAGNQQLLVAKALEKVRQNPVSIYEGGYGEPLGNKGGTNLTGLFKVKLKADLFLNPIGCQANNTGVLTFTCGTK